MRILFTGASSFTGLWFVKALVKAGHQVIAPLRRPVYSGLKRERVKQLEGLCELIYDAPFGSPRFLNVTKEETFDLFCHHAAEVANYKSPAFNVSRAINANTYQLDAVLDALQAPVTLTGTVFEAAASPYGVSKAMTGEIFEKCCKERGLPLKRFIISNPFGPFEEARFTAYLMGQWKRGETAVVKTPDYVRDNIHVPFLAKAYVEQDTNFFSPSGYVETQGEFTARFAREIRKRLGWECPFTLAHQTDFSEPMCLAGQHPLRRNGESAAWDAIADYYIDKAYC